jgi:tryptophan 2,3-dioxygenase
MSADGISYTSYLQIPSILSVQRPLTPRADEDTWAAERFFIVCHQTSELWLSQVFVDMQQAASRAELGDWQGVRVPLERAISMVQLLTAHLAQLTYLPRDCFMRFRIALNGASGADSKQFQELLFGPYHPQLSRIKTSLAQANPAAPHSPGACDHARCAAAAMLKALIAGIVAWREMHAKVTGYLIGDLPGTGGTEGVAYLLKRIADAATDWPGQEALPG